MEPQPVEDAGIWDESGHSPAVYVTLLRERGLLSPWWPDWPTVPYAPGGPPFPSSPLAGGLVP